MLRQDAGRFMLGKYLSDKKIPWQQRRQLGMAVARNTPTASFLKKIGMMQSVCRIAREARSESTDGLVDETHGHINSAGCEGMATKKKLRLPNTPSGGTCMTACTLHKSQKASSSLSRLTKKTT